MLVSIVMPVRDGADSLSTAIGSVVAQDWSRWELLIVDDGSEDGTAGLIRTWERRDPRIRGVSLGAPRGIVAALTRGLELASGPLIARLDADDVAHPRRLREQIHWLGRCPEIGLVGCCVAFGGDRRTQGGYAAHVDWVNGLVSCESIELNRFVESPLVHPSVMFRRDLIARWGGYRDGDFPEDYELWLRWLEAGVGMAKVPRELLTWNDSDRRLSRRDPRYSADAFYRLKAEYLARAIQRTRRGRPVWIWGAGRPTRRRASHLEEHGVQPTGYIDVDPRKQGRRIAGRPVIAPSALPLPDEAMVLAYVGVRGARERIRDALCHRGYIEGRDFWVAA